MLLLWLFTILCSQLSLAQITTDVQDATVSALTYGYPLLAYEKVRIVTLINGPNKWLHFRQLQGAGSTAVVKPNVDTLYSALVFDISHDDFLFSIPDGIPANQFVLFSFFDPFGTNFANVGTGNFDKAGKYQLRQQIVNSTTNVTPSTDAGIQAYIESSSLYGFVLIRWLVNSTNLDVISGWQNQTLNQSIPVQPRAPSLASLPTYNKSATDVDNVLNLLAALGPYTLPASTSQAANITSTLAAAGLKNGSYTAQPGVDLTAANSTAIANIVKSAASPSALTTLNNGWTAANASLIGIYDDNYAFRSAVASGGYLAIKAPNAIYPSWSNGSSATPLGGTFTLGANDAILFTFSSKPPLQAAGFWSLTAYQNNYLIANQYNVYAVTSERSNLTYADGSLLYGPTSTNTSDRSYQILVQPADVAPPANWTSNWLPGPPGGGDMQVTLRLYGAQQSLLAGDWQYPVVTKVAALRAGNSSSNSTSSPTSSGTPSVTSSTVTTYTGGSNAIGPTAFGAVFVPLLMTMVMMF